MGWSFTDAAMGFNVTEDVPALANISHKLGALLAYPSRLVARIRKMDDLLNHDTENVFDARMHEFDHSGATRPSASTMFAPLPGPWGFLTSGYILGLIVMAILLHRIQNIVVPPRHPFLRRHSRLRGHHRFIIRTLYFSIFPLDLSSTFCRFIFRMPSLYYISKVTLMWIVTLMQTAGISSTSTSLWIQDTTQLVARTEMTDLCWSTFCAVCAVLCVEALTRGLEGATGNTSPFNLFGYAFSLHIYSSPVTHDTKVENMASRPDAHVIFTMLLPLIQLAMVHFMGLKRQWSHQRLIPSTVVSMLSLIHFFYVTWFSDATYPLLNYMPCLFESILVSVTLLAIFLNIFTQIITEGTISRPLFGHHATLLPKWDEDFSIALLRLGTASLEASSVAGLGNEVGGVAALDPAGLAMPQMEYGVVEMNRSGVMSISSAVKYRGNKRKVKKGFANEIKTVKASSGEGDLWMDMAWYRELARFGVGVGRCLKSLWRLLRSILRRRSLRHQDLQVVVTNEGSATPQRGAEDTEPDEEDMYQSFIRGDNVDDEDDDEDFEPSQLSRTGSVDTQSSTSDVEDDDDDDLASSEDPSETISLYADLSSSASASTSAPLLLAHMTDNSKTPLTRRRYMDLISGQSSRSTTGRNNWTNSADGLRSTSCSAPGSLDDAQAEGRRNCVICTAEPRQIICWPCRCLALCDDCRENLATRSSASKHTCPCCRRNVEGYSKIYIP